MPNLNEFLTGKNQELETKGYQLEQLGGVRPCSQCKEDVSGALWDPIEFLMTWECKNGHKNSFKVG